MYRTDPRVALVSLVVFLLSIWAEPTRATSDGVDAYLKAEEAVGHLRAQRWKEAAAVYQDVVAVNPHSGRSWERLASSLLNSNREAEAIEAYQACIELGYRPVISMYNIACCHSRMGQVDDALDWLERAYSAGFVDEHLLRTDGDLDPLRPLGRFAQITGQPEDLALDRESRWARDLEFLERRLKEVHYDLHGVLSVDEFHQRMAALRSGMASHTDEQMRWQVQSLLAAIGDGHTSVVPDRFMAMHGPADGGVEIFAMTPWWYDDGVYLNACDPNQADAVGARIVSVGGVEIGEALRRIDAVVSRDNDWGAKWITMETLRTPSAMRALGMASDEANLILEVLADGTKRHVQVPVVPLSQERQLAGPGNRSAEPFFADRSHELHWFERIGDLAYLQFNSVQNSHHQTIERMTEDLFSMIQSEELQYLVIDLRKNHGGNSHLARPLVHAVLRSPVINRPGHLFVVTGRETFSAAMNFATTMSVETEAIFVGEPTGSRPNFVGETSLFVLPYSQLWISCSSRYHQGTESNDLRRWLAPDIFAPMTPDLFFSGHDPVMEAIMQLIGDQGGPSGSGLDRSSP